MSEIRVTTLKDTSGNNSSTTEQIASGRAKAWVNFNGGGVVAIRAEFNVNSITDHTTGTYTVNFTSALTDANYVFQGNGFSCKNYNEDDVNIVRTTTAIRILTRESSNASQVDPGQVSVAIFR